MLNRIDLIRPDAPSQAQRGNWPVGVRTLHLVNRDQPDALGPPGAIEDRDLTVEFWYPALENGPGASYPTLLRDGYRAVTLSGSASRGVGAAAGEFPLVILSHGYPGNRMLLAHFGEHLASHGYRVASIDHLHSTYGDPAYRAGKAFAATLVHRPLDVAFVAEELGGDFAVIGYSMGGYGALVLAGGGISAAALTLENAPAPALLLRHRLPRPPARLKAILPIGPWGRARGVWDAAGLGQVRLPSLIMAGSLDDVSGYDNGMRLIWQELGGPSHLLTFQNAGHNAAAPIPAPVEAGETSAYLDWSPHGHYADPVWDSIRMNNLAHHFALAFLDVHLRGDTAAARHLAPGQVAPGLMLETRLPGQ
jgi:predicted dienelactone hydrolase